MKTSLIVSLFIAVLVPLSACVTGADDAEDPSEAGDDATLDPPATADVNAPQQALVGIPSNYVYNTKLGTLHDYCTKSPDEFPNPVGANANFRGPCARHDLCLEAKTPSQTCNNRLWLDLVNNCQATYGVFNPVRQACINTAHVYWVAVTINTHLP